MRFSTVHDRPGVHRIHVRQGPGRPVFNKMLELAEDEVPVGLLTWHPDRLARNSVDDGRIVYLLDTGKLSAPEFPTFWFENTPQEKFMLTIAFEHSKYYVDNQFEARYPGLEQMMLHWAEGMPPKEWKEQLSWFARDVMPAFRGRR